MNATVDAPQDAVPSVSPARARKWETTEDGLVRILVPRFNGRILGRFLMPRLRDPFFRVRLDEVGSFIWELCDGARNWEEIASLLEERFPDMEDARDRLGLFLNHLLAQGHVGNIR